VWHSFGSPCLGGFHPLYPLAGPPPASLALGGRTFDPASPWWLNERVQRRADAYPSLKGLVQAPWADAERGSFAAVAAAERRAALLPASEASAVLRAVGEERAVSLLATLGELDDLTARQVPDLAGPSPADRAHWASLNEPVGLVLEAQLVS
jgi:dipeptidase